MDFFIESQIKTFATFGDFPATGAVKTIYINEATSEQYYWNGLAYVLLSTDLTGYVSYTGATGNVDLGTHSLSAKNIIVDHAIGSGVAVSITKGGAGEALTIIKTSGSGNAASITGGVTLLDELHLTTDLADAYIASATNWNNKVAQTRTLTINGVTQDLSADRTFTISTGLTIGTTPITSGTIGRVLFEGTGNVVQESANLFWDNANIRLGIGTSAPSSTIEVVGTAKVTTLLPTTGGFTGSVGTSAVPFANMYAVNYNSPGNATLIASQSTYLGAGNTFGFALFQSTRNVLIQNGGTYTDAGFRLDVNGTARVSGQLTVNSQIQIAGNTKFFATNSSAYYINLQSGSNTVEINGFSGVNFLTGTGTERMRVASTGSILINTSTDVASSLLTMESTTKGFLPPRMTTTQRNAIASPAAGLVVYDNTDNKHYGYNGTTWNAFY